MVTTAEYRKTILLVTYYDRSELLYLPEEKRYVWMRPNYDRTKMFETRINANNHHVAIMAIRAKSYKEVEIIN